MYGRLPGWSGRAKGGGDGASSKTLLSAKGDDGDGIQLGRTPAGSSASDPSTVAIYRTGSSASTLSADSTLADSEASEASTPVHETKPVDVVRTWGQ
eukprot:2674200-Rhodomonas_salina.1